MLLGAPISAALPRVSAAKGAPKHCLLCRTEEPSYMCIGPCGHAEVCWVCAVRLRALGQDKCCPVCKEEANEVVIVDDCSLPFPPRHRLSSLPGELSFGVRFANATIERECMRLF
jgi:hypothetical protein